MKDKFQTLTSTCVPIPSENIDTDQIIPARFLKATSRQGFGDNLFRDWRYDKEGNPISSFVLNNPAYSGTILVAGKNFGSGSSREHAACAGSSKYIVTPSDPHLRACRGGRQEMKTAEIALAVQFRSFLRNHHVSSQRGRKAASP